MTRERLYHLRELIVRAAKSLSDADAFGGKELFDFWSGDGVAYEVGDRRREGEELYKCLQAHTSQETWKPSVSPSLWVRIDDPSQEWPEWVQPVGGTDAYQMGAKVSHNGKHWVSDYDNNVWEPGVFGWHEA
jgi:hypothetical protein